MQNSDPIRMEPYRPGGLPPARGLDLPGTGLAGSDSFKLGMEAAPTQARLTGTAGPDRRARHPDSDDTRNGIFERLVAGDEDIAGLVAYSIYKQHKRDWLKAFETHVNRAPTLEEETAYTIGEATQRRLAMYRHVAEETLVGQGPPQGAKASDSADSVAPRPAPVATLAATAARAPAQPRRSAKGTLLLFLAYAAIIAFAVYGCWAAIRYIFPSMAH